MDVRVTGTTIESKDGNILLTGVGSPNGTTANRGVDIQDAMFIRSTGAGNITIDGKGGGTSGANNYGTLFESDVQVIASGTGGISITGQGGFGSPLLDLFMAPRVVLDSSAASANRANRQFDVD